MSTNVNEELRALLLPAHRKSPSRALDRSREPNKRRTGALGRLRYKTFHLLSAHRRVFS